MFVFINGQFFDPHPFPNQCRILQISYVRRHELFLTKILQWLLKRIRFALNFALSFGTELVMVKCDLIIVKCPWRPPVLAENPFQIKRTVGLFFKPVIILELRDWFLEPALPSLQKSVQWTVTVDLKRILAGGTWHLMWMTA